MYDAGGQNKPWSSWALFLLWTYQVGNQMQMRCLD